MAHMLYTGVKVYVNPYLVEQLIQSKIEMQSENVYIISVEALFLSGPGTMPLCMKWIATW